MRTSDQEARIVALLERQPDLPLREVARRLRIDFETVFNVVVKQMNETGSSQIPHILRSAERRTKPRGTVRIQF
jgi:hypothetical protein